MHSSALLVAAACFLTVKTAFAFSLVSPVLYRAPRATSSLRTPQVSVSLRACRMAADVGFGADNQFESDTGSESGSWQRLASRVFENDKRPVILYDGVCNLCNGGVNFMLDWDKPEEPRGTFRFAALQSEVGKALLQRGGRCPDDLSSIVLATPEGNTYTESEAILRIGQGLGGGTVLWPWAPVASRIALLVVPPFIRDKVYDMVSENRYRFFGQSEECRLWDDRFDERFIPDMPEE